MGVGWAKRKIALAFRPELSFAVVDGVLQVLMPSPIGERLERLPIDQEVIDIDPSGNTFVKVSSWDGTALVTVARDASGKAPEVVTNLTEVVTRRVIRDDGCLVQTSTASGGKVCFQRVFHPKPRK